MRVPRYPLQGLSGANPLRLAGVSLIYLHDVLAADPMDTFNQMVTHTAMFRRFAYFKYFIKTMGKHHFHIWYCRQRTPLIARCATPTLCVDASSELGIVRHS